MTLKKDLSDIGYLLITPNPKKFRFEGVNYDRAAKQVLFGSFGLQLATLGLFFVGPKIADVVYETKKKVTKKLKK